MSHHSTKRSTSAWSRPTTPMLLHETHCARQMPPHHPPTTHSANESSVAMCPSQRNLGLRFASAVVPSWLSRSLQNCRLPIGFPIWTDGCDSPEDFSSAER